MLYIRDTCVATPPPDCEFLVAGSVYPVLKAEGTKVLGASWHWGAAWPGLHPPNLSHGGLPPCPAHLSAELRERERVLYPGLLVHLSDTWGFSFCYQTGSFMDAAPLAGGSGQRAWSGWG